VWWIGINMSEVHPMRRGLLETLLSMDNRESEVKLLEILDLL
jgi:hypothetical protein